MTIRRFASLALVVFTACGTPPMPTPDVRNGGQDAAEEATVGDDVASMEDTLEPDVFVPPDEPIIDTFVPPPDVVMDVQTDVAPDVLMDAPRDTTTDVRDVITDTRDAATATLRTWTGATAGLRLIDGRQLTNAAGTRLCVYGTDDPNPYAVLTAVSTSPGSTTVLMATYGRVPAGIPLRATATFSTTPVSNAPSSCNATNAVPLNGGRALTAMRFYTAVHVDYDDFFHTCATATRGDTNQCVFFPRPARATMAPCATVGVYTVEDGQGSAGVRIVNATSTASMLRVGGVAGTGIGPRVHISLGSLVNAGYDISNTDGMVRVCPGYLDCSWSGTALALVNANDACSASRPDPRFQLGVVTNPRLLMRSLHTTVYVLGDPGALRTTNDGLQSSEVSFVVANDVSN